MPTNRENASLSVPAMSLGFAVAAVVTGIVLGGWMWGMMGGIGMMGVGGGVPGHEYGHMPYGYGFGHMGYGMGLAYAIGLFVVGAIFGGLVAAVYNRVLRNDATGANASVAESSKSVTSK